MLPGVGLEQRRDLGDETARPLGADPELRRLAVGG